jgi:hypothetical protein
LFATVGATLGATEASTDGAAVGAVVGLGLAAAVQAPTMSVMAPRLAAQAESREWVGRLRTCAPPLPLDLLGSDLPHRSLDPG